MKNYRLEFVVVNISQKRAMNLWNFIVKLIELIGYDVTGDVIDENVLAHTLEKLDQAMEIEPDSDLLEEYNISFKNLGHSNEPLEPDGFPK